MKHVEVRIGHILKDMKTDLILKVLTAMNGNKSRTAKVLGMSLRSLNEWITKRPELSEFRGPDYLARRRGRKD